MITTCTYYIPTRNIVITNRLYPYFPTSRTRKHDTYIKTPAQNATLPQTNGARHSTAEVAVTMATSRQLSIAPPISCYNPHCKDKISDVSWICGQVVNSQSESRLHPRIDTNGCNKRGRWHRHVVV